MWPEGFSGEVCVTESNWRETRKSRVQRTIGLLADGEGPEHASDRSEGKPPTVRRLEPTKTEASESRGSVDEAPLDDDPRVIMGLNRLIDIIADTPNSKPRAGAKDD